MQFKPIEDEQIDPEIEDAIDEIKKGGKPTKAKIYDVPLTEEDDFFKRVVRKPFQEDDEDVVLIDPGIDAGSIFGAVELPCNKATRKNNAVNAEVVSNARPNYAGWQIPAKHTAFATAQDSSPLLSERKSVKEAQKMFKSGG